MKWPALIGLLSACALTSKSAPLDIEYFAPEQAATTERPPPDESRTKVRLRRVGGGSHLRSRIAYRTSPVELEFYETRRWTEPPETYARRALEKALYDRGVLVTGGRALELEVEVSAFEEVRSQPPTVRVGLRYRVIDRREVIAENTIEVTRPAGTDFESIVVAISDALDEASADVAEAVLERGEPARVAIPQPPRE